MPFGYVASVALVALCTLLALWPRRPPSSTRFNFSFLFGFLVNELPFVALAWLIADTGLAALQGDLTTPLGLVGAAVAAATVAGLVVIVRRALSTPPVLRRALEGDGASLTRHARPTPWPRIVLWPFPTRGRDVERIRNLAYDRGGRFHRLDLYRPRGRLPTGPTFVHFHGGAFRIGNKSREARPLLHHLARLGCVCVSANYRLTPHATFPDQLIDVKRVLAWIREHGAGHGADTQHIVVSGSSAGAHLASLAALTINDPSFQPGFESADTSVDAVIALYGYYGSIETTGPPSSPLDYTRPDRPPFLVVHGEYDTLVIVEDARALVDQLRAASSAPALYAELPGAQHDFDLVHSIRFEAVVDAVTAFIRGVVSRWR
jgi:acetyl esterase/lipase